MITIAMFLSIDIDLFTKPARRTEAQSLSFDLGELENTIARLQTEVLVAADEASRAQNRADELKHRLTEENTRLERLKTEREKLLHRLFLEGDSAVRAEILKRYPEESDGDS